MDKKLPSIGIAAVVVIVVVTYLLSASGKYDDFARCLTEKGAAMYGAYWCPHCQDQKAEFGKSFQYVTAIECAEKNNPNVQTPACKDAGIAGYPTWIFADGTRQEGKAEFEYLSVKSGCPLP